MINQITKMRLPDGTEVAFVDWSDQPLWSTAYMLTGFTDDEVSFFTYAAGEQIAKTANIATGRAAFETDTNIAVASSMQATEEMLVYAVKPTFAFFTYSSESASIAASDLVVNAAAQTGLPNPTMVWLKILGESLVLRLWISQKVMLEEKLAAFNTGFGPAGQAAMAPSATVVSRTYATAGVPSQEAVRSLAMPVYIGGTEKYRVTFSNFGNLFGATSGAIDFGWAEDSDGSQSAISTLICRAEVHLDGLYKRPVS